MVLCGGGDLESLWGRGSRRDRGLREMFLRGVLESFLKGLLECFLKGLLECLLPRGLLDIL